VQFNGAQKVVWSVSMQASETYKTARCFMCYRCVINFLHFGEERETNKMQLI